MPFQGLTLQGGAGRWLRGWMRSFERMSLCERDLLSDVPRRQVLGGEMMLHALRELDRAELRSASPPPRISLIKKVDIPRGLLRD